MQMGTLAPPACLAIQRCRVWAGSLAVWQWSHGAGKHVPERTKLTKRGETDDAKRIGTAADWRV